MELQCKNPQEVAKEVCWLAWKATGTPTGLGFLQNKPGATRDDVWDCIVGRDDYDGFGRLAGNAIDADYVFGRMVKLGLQWTETAIQFSDNVPRRDYQGWIGVYPTYEALVRAALKNVGG